MTIEIAAAAGRSARARRPPARRGAAPVQVGYGVSLDRHRRLPAGAGRRAGRASRRGRSARRRRPRKQLMKPFEHINGEAAQLSLDAERRAERRPRA